jgi:glycosyltransferase involved in cell wall biosynthesis
VAASRNGIVLTQLFPNAAEPTRGTYVLQETREIHRRLPLRVLAPLPYVPPFLRKRDRFAFHSAPAREERDGIEVHYPRHLVIPRGLRFAYGLLMKWGCRRAFRRLAAERRPDFLIAHFVFPDGYAAEGLARSRQLPVLIKARGSDVNLYTRGRLRRWLTRRTLNRADRVVCVSRALKERIVALGIAPERVQVVTNGVDRERFRPLDRAACRRELGLAPEPFLLLFVGDLRPVKGVAELLEAFAALPAEGRREARLILVGEGELEEALRRRVAALGLEDRVSLRRPVLHAAIPRWLGACDALVLPSVAEGYPNVLLEALACDRPVLATRVGGIPEIVQDGKTGILVPPGDPAALTAALERMMGGFAFDASGADAIRRGWDRVADEMIELVEGMLAERGGDS